MHSVFFIVQWHHITEPAALWRWIGSSRACHSLAQGIKGPDLGPWARKWDMCLGRWLAHGAQHRGRRPGPDILRLGLCAQDVGTGEAESMMQWKRIHFDEHIWTPNAFAYFALKIECLLYVLQPPNAELLVWVPKDGSTTRWGTN